MLGSNGSALPRHVNATAPIATTDVTFSRVSPSLESPRSKHESGRAAHATSYGRRHQRSWSIDEQYAARSFIGKSIREAEFVFAESYSDGFECLHYMGPKAFSYYVHAAIKYLVDSQAADESADDVALSCFLNVVKRFLHAQRDEIASVLSVLQKAVRYILDHWEKFVTDEAESCVPNLKADFANLSSELGIAIGRGVSHDSRDLNEILSEISDQSDRETQRLFPAERLMLEAVIRLVQSGGRVANEEEALELIAPANEPGVRSQPSYVCAFVQLRRRGLLTWFQDKSGAWEIRPTSEAIERLRQESWND